MPCLLMPRPARLGSLLGLLLATFPAAASAANLGFEQGPLGPAAPGWTFQGTDAATVVAAEGGGDFAVYSQFGIEVPPLLGDQSLRLGTPKQVNEAQSRGATTALSEAFTLSERNLSVAFRLFSLEHRGDDRLIFEVLDEREQPIAASFTFRPSTPRPAGSVELGTITSGCGTGPACDLVINIGRRSQRPADTGPYELVMTLPESAVGEPIRLRYTLLPGGNEAHASWAYFDSINRAPQPTARINPGGSADNPALEGDFVVADCLEALDPDGDTFTCEWMASGGGLAAPKSATGPISFFWFPDDNPAAAIRLTVTDAAGQSATRDYPVQIRNAQPVVNAVNAETLADAPTTTVCRFADAGIGRYGDGGAVPGEEESHVFVGTAEVIDSAEEFSPSFSSGRFDLRVEESGICTVQDKDFGQGSDAYLVRVVDPAELRFRLGDESRSGGAGGNETFDAAHALEVDWKYLGAISDPTDIDVYRVVKGGAPLRTGSELVVSLEGMPADYDLLVFSNGGSTQASPFFNAPFFNAPFFNAPFFNAPFFNAPFFNAQFDSAPFFNAPFFNAPFFNAPFFNAPVKKSPFFNAGDPGAPFNRAFTELPLSHVGLAAPDGSQVSNSDISVAELGSLSLRTLQATPGVSLKALSAEPGVQPEKVLVKVAPGETEIYVVVVGNQLAFSATRAYELTLEASSPPSQAALLAGTGFCEGERVDPSDPQSAFKFAGTWSDPGDAPATSGATLILTQRERFEVEQAASAESAVAAGRFADESAFWRDFWSRIDEYAARTNGVVVSVGGGLFEQADRNPCSVAVRNALAREIRDRYVTLPGTGGTPARFRSGSLESVVIVGGQNVIPLFAVPDETVVGNERDFTTDLWVRPGTPLSVAAAEGYNLTDAAYVDLQPTPFRGRELYLEDRAVARLLESPEAIAADLDAFLKGSINQGRLAMGYDFFCDGTEDVAAILGVGAINGPPCAPASPPWTAAELRDEFLGGGDAMCLAPDAPDPLELALVNAHMTTYAALSAAGFESGTASPPEAPGFTDIVASTESAQCLLGTTTATIGCHSGLDVPSAWALPAELGLPFDAGRDWVEEIGNLIAPRGYGLGDNTVANRGTEGIMTLLFEELADGKNLGEALVTAKRRYVMSLRELDVHDEDSLVNLALFGPPQLTFSLAGPLSASATSAAAMAFGTLGLKLLEGNGDGSEDYLLGSQTGTADFDLIQKTDSSRGSWFEIDPGAAQATYGRPLLPVTLPVEDRLVNPGDTRVHGVALVSRDAPVSPCPVDGSGRACTIAARYLDLGDQDGDGIFDFDPVFPLPQHDWLIYETALTGSAPEEPATCVDTLAPTQLGVASTLDNGLEARQSLVVGAGQFRCEPDETTNGEPVRGQHRLYQEIQLTALHPVGDSAAERAVRDEDFDPPQVTLQTVVSNPADGSVTATLKASDALTGGSGISEIIALVYWDEASTVTGTGMVESYSAKPQGALTAEPFEHTFTLENARGKLLAFQYVDGAGNLTQKSLKGSLFLALDVEILTTLLTVTEASTVSVRVGDYCKLEAPSISYQLDGGDPVIFNADDPPEGISVSVTAANDPERPCDRVLVIGGIDFSGAASDGQVTLTVEIRGTGAFGADTEVVSACSDPDEPDVIDEADILACGFAVEAAEVVIDMFLAGVISADVQYRVDLPDFSAQFKYFQLGKTSAPGGTQLKVNVVRSTPSGSQLEFRIRNLGNLGWNGVAPLRFSQATQTGQPGTPGQGFPDNTAVFTGIP